MKKPKKNHSSGYIMIYKPDHPFCDEMGYVYEHRLVMESKLGGFIPEGQYHVHHINGIKNDNREDNLQLVTTLEHRRIHEGWTKVEDIWFKECGSCNERKEVCQDNFYQRKSNSQFLSFCIPCCRKVSKHFRSTTPKKVECLCKICGKIFNVRYKTNPLPTLCSRDCLGKSYALGITVRGKPKRSS